MEEIVRGTIKCIKPKGFGFIIPDDGGKDVFFHHTQLLEGVVFEELKEGQPVEFERFTNSNGDNARCVKPVAFNS